MGRSINGLKTGDRVYLEELGTLGVVLQDQGYEEDGVHVAWEDGSNSYISGSFVHLQ